MKKITFFIVTIFGLLFFQSASASDYTQVISLSPGWNLISTPRIVESHQFSASETLSNFSIYLQSNNSISGWKTMSEIGQQEFTPLYGYFVNNKTGTNQTLALNYKQSNSPTERLFSRTLTSGWNVIGVANPSYALKQNDSFSLDNNNNINILNSISSSVSTVLDITSGVIKSSVKVGDSWSEKIFSDINSLDDFRETKAYAVYLNNSSEYAGFQNDNPVSDDNNYIATSTVSVLEKSTNPSNGDILSNTNSIIALIANIKTDESVTADGIKVYIATSSASFENVKVYLNGYLVDSFEPTATGSVIIDSSTSLNKGDNEVKVTVDTAANAVFGDKFQIKLISEDSSLLINPKYSNGSQVSSVDINGYVNGAILTVNGPSASIVRSDGYSSRVIAQGVANASIGKFSVRASGDDITITKITIASTTGNTLPYTSVDDVIVRIDGTQVGTTKSFTSTGVSLSSLSVNIAKDTTKVIEVFSTIDTSATGTLKIALSLTAKDSNGGNVVIDTVESVSCSVIGQGSLTVVKDSNSADSAILASKNGVEQTIASFRLTAIDDSAKINKFKITNASTTDARISSYKLYNSAGTLLSTANPFSGETEFTISDSALTVAANSSSVITVKAVFNNIDNDVAATDKVLAITNSELEFQSSNGLRTTIYPGIISNTFYIRKTVPTVALMTLPNTTLTSGTQVISKFTVSADANADVKISRLAVKYSATASTSLATTSSPVKVNGTSKSTNVTSSIADGYIYVDFGTTTPEIVSAGSTKTFEIVTNVTVTGSNRESLSTSIEEASYVAGGSTLVNGSLTWSDSASNIDANNIWFNSFRVKGLPTDTQTLSIN